MSKRVTAEYERLRAQHSDAIILLRKEHEYVAFGKDAQKVAIAVHGIEPKIACEMNGGITEYRCSTAELAVILPRLVRAGHRVAICEK